MTKTCSSCKIEKPLPYFSKSKKPPYSYHTRCAVCVEKASIGIAKPNPKLKEIQDWVGTYLLEHPCVDCGNSDILVLEFDHVRGTKKDNLNILMRKSNLESVKEEIAKCDVRCVNCHRKKTNKERSNE